MIRNEWRWEWGKNKDWEKKKEQNLEDLISSENFIDDDIINRRRSTQEKKKKKKNLPTISSPICWHADAIMTREKKSKYLCLPMY